MNHDTNLMIPIGCVYHVDENVVTLYIFFIE